MRILIVEDDFASRRLMMHLLTPYGVCDIAVDGDEAVSAYESALKENDPYSLVCLDIMLPKMDGQKALEEIRRVEGENGIRPGQGAKIVMTTALGDGTNIMKAFRDQCDGYLVKPIDKQAIVEQLRTLKLIP